jgi:hypothetical protein
MRSLRLVFALLAGGPALLAAQHRPLGAGTWAAGVNTRIALSLGNGPTAWGIDATPHLAHFILPGLSLSAGARGAYYAFGTGSKRLWAVGPELTWYVVPGGVVTPYVSAGVQYGWYSEAADGAGRQAIQGTEWQTAGGVLWRVAHAVGLQGGFAYGPARFRFDQASRSAGTAPRQFRPNLGLQFFF